jgi:transposase
MQVEYFAQIYELTYQLFSLHYSPPQALRYHIRRVDTTMVCEQARKLEEGMSVGRKKNGKKQVKIAVSLTEMFPSSLDLFTAQAALSDDIALPVEIFKQVDTAQDNIVVFDRGLAAHSCYAQMQTSQIWFVTRLKENVRYQHISHLQQVTGIQIGNLTLLSDEQISFPRHPQLYFRLIRAHNEKGKTLSFLTNRFDLSVEEVIRYYHKRWDIEVFFRFLKQELNLSHLISMNANGITIILYITMIAAMLLLVYKKRNQWGYKTAKRRFIIELDQYIIALIVEACGGDSSKWINLPYFNPSSEHT